MTQNFVIRIFLASPMDLVNERELFRKTITQINDFIGKKLGVVYEVICWENDVSPNSGIDAQDVVNQQINRDYDIFCSVFGKRLGTPTKRYSSGTVEEYERAKLMKTTRTDLKIMCYFVGNEASEEVNAFKSKLTEDGVLFCENSDPEQFENNVYKHFTALLFEYSKKAFSLKNTQSMQSESLQKSVSVAIVCQDKVLIVKRGKTMKYGSGLWQIPGGKIETNEEARDAACREIMEELGISLSKNDLKRVATFHDTNIAQKTDKIEMELFLCKLNDFDQHICLNEENEVWEWFDLEDIDFTGKTFFGLTRKMIIAVWREQFLNCYLEDVLTCYGCSESYPSSGDTGFQLSINAIYALLNVLGIMRFDNRLVPAGEFDNQIIQAFLCIARNGESIFSERSVELFNNLRLHKNDYLILKKKQENLLSSHENLLSLLSCITELENSSRKVCDVLVFGNCNGELYLLMRWDFFSNKYQFISSGLEKDAVIGDSENNARFVMKRRFGQIVNNYLNYFGIGNFTTRHFSAGSVKNDPILRSYHIDVVSAQMKQSNKDVVEFINGINEATAFSIQYSNYISKEQSKEFAYYRWCKLDELFHNRNHFEGRMVRGVEEVLANLGESNIRRHIHNVIEVDAVQTKEDFDKLLERFHAVVQKESQV